MFKMLKGKLPVMLSVGSVLAAPAAMADDFDVTAVTTAITSAGVAVATIGAAVLIVIFGAKAWKWIRSAG